MNLFRYTYAWIASCLTVMLLCFLALYAMGIRSTLVSVTQQQLNSHAAYIEHQLERTRVEAGAEQTNEPDYPAILAQLSLVSPLVETRIHVLATNEQYTSTSSFTGPTKNTLPDQSRDKLTGTVLSDPTLAALSFSTAAFWPDLSVQRTQLVNSSQAISYSASMPIGVISHNFVQQFIPGASMGIGFYLFSMLTLFFVFKRKLLPLSQLAQQSASLNKQLPDIVLNSLEAQAWVNMRGHFKKQLDDIFRQQALEANKLKAQAYQDKVSGLGNRHYFINQLNAWLDTPQQGGLILLKSTLLDEVYQQNDFEKGDSFTRQLAEDLNSNIVHAQVYLARLSYDEFAVLLPNISTEKLQHIAKDMQKVHQRQEKAYRGDTSDSVFLGLLIIEQASNASHVLGQLDNILAQATRNPAEPIQLAKKQHQVPSFGKQQWKSLLLEAIENNAMDYKYQPVINERQQQYHFEVFSSLKSQQSRYHANQFLGAIEDVGAGMLLDKHVIAHHINILNADPSRGPFAINLSTNSITDPAFNRWLDQALARNPHLAERLHFEIPETCFIRTPDACSLLCSAIRFYKFKYGVDGYGRYFKSLAYLEEFRPDYAKVDYSYTHQLNDELKKQLLSSICRTAHSLNIMTIATRVETETQLERLSDLFVSGFQGFYTEQTQKDRRAFKSANLRVQ
ncbi:GGDEF domain-containing protein [Photobacterium rosenbergii]|uniref:GGDEF domain-containing protein n=1 Tax=Photobacterium rosenbergii TaxID=294936 RepID=A0ABU3ZII2_9GAMM|nr:GGDEF domain-containing protein [Photobacterium rosenbergii]MDV5169892.1 GGDEF domain-containing protein [Photobacterium rosenbergii]